MKEESFYPNEQDEKQQEQGAGVSLEKQRQSIYKEGVPQRQGEYCQSGSAQEEASRSYAYDASTQGNPYGSDVESMRQEGRREESQGFGIASMTLGILSLLLFCTCVNVVLAIVAIVFGIVQLGRTENRKAMAVTGIVTSVLSLILLVIFIIAFMGSADFQQGFREVQENFNYNYEDGFYDDYDQYDYDYDDADDFYEDGGDGFDIDFPDEDFTF